MKQALKAQFPDLSSAYRAKSSLITCGIHEEQITISILDNTHHKKKDATKHVDMPHRFLNHSLKGAFYTSLLSLTTGTVLYYEIIRDVSIGLLFVTLSGAIAGCFLGAFLHSSHMLLEDVEDFTSTQIISNDFIVQLRLSVSEEPILPYRNNLYQHGALSVSVIPD